MSVLIRLSFPHGQDIAIQFWPTTHIFVNLSLISRCAEREYDPSKLGGNGAYRRLQLHFCSLIFCRLLSAQLQEMFWSRVHS